MMKCVVAGKGVVEQTVPTLKKAHDVLIKVKAFGINGPDVFQNKGQYPPPPGVTDILGLELSGVVVDAKDQALINKEVVTLVPGGAYAEFCVADSRMLLDLPFPKTDKERFIKSAGIPGKHTYKPTNNKTRKKQEITSWSLTCAKRTPTC